MRITRTRSWKIGSKPKSKPKSKRKMTADEKAAERVNRIGGYSAPVPDRYKPTYDELLAALNLEQGKSSRLENGAASLHGDVLGMKNKVTSLEAENAKLKKEVALFNEILFLYREKLKTDLREKKDFEDKAFKDDWVGAMTTSSMYGKFGRVVAPGSTFPTNAVKKETP